MLTEYGETQKYYYDVVGLGEMGRCWGGVEKKPKKRRINEGEWGKGRGMFIEVDRTRKG